MFLHHIIKQIKSLRNKPSYEVFLKSCEEGNKEIYDEICALLTPGEKDKYITANNHYSFHLAMGHGHIEIFNDIFQHIIDKHKTTSHEAITQAFNEREGEGFMMALRHPHIDMIERILSEKCLYQQGLDIIYASDEFLEIIWHTRLQKIIIILFNQACHQNTNEVKRILKVVPGSEYHLLLMTETIEITNHFSVNVVSPFQAACNQGNINLLKLIWGLYDNRVKKGLMNNLFPTCMHDAVNNGHANIIKKLLEWLPSEQQTQVLGHEEFSVLATAANNGFDNIIELMWAYIPTGSRITAISANNYAAYRLAKVNNHPKTIALLEAIVPPHLKGKMLKSVDEHL